MSLFRMIRYGIRDAIKSVHRNISLSVASIFCITITLLVVVLAIIVAFNVENFSEKAGNNVTIVTLTQLGVSEEEIEQFEAKLKQMDNVLPGWEKQTPAERREEVISQNELLSNIVKDIENPGEVLHYRFDIKVKDFSKIEETKKELLSMSDIVYEAEYGDNSVNRMINMFDIAGKVATVVALILILVSVFLIINTIKLTIFSRRKEISIMRVVGASNMTIKIPFIIEGFIIGLLGSVVPVLVTIFGYKAFYDTLDNGHFMTFWLEFIKPEPFIYLVSLIIIATGVFVGMLGSSRAVRKYLKV